MAEILTIVDSLKELYAKMGGSPADVEDISTVTEMIQELSEVAGGGSSGPTIRIVKVGDFGVTCEAKASVSLSPTLYVQDDELRTGGYTILNIDWVRRTNSAPATPLLIERWHTSTQGYGLVNNSGNLTPMTLVAYNPSDAKVTNQYYDVYAVFYKA